MRVARTQAQAKVNLFLRVGPRDASGYHEITTLFHRIDLADDVVVRVGGSVRALDCAGPQLPPAGLGDPDKNLAYRAAAAFAERAGWPRGFAIELTKNIPVGGGLGGGSADAGAVLRALEAMAPRPIGAEALQGVAASLGSDVPFFASEHASAKGSGRGETLEPAPATPYPALLLVPRFSISTADAYRWLDEFREAGTSPPSDPTGNDFEPVVEARYPELCEYRTRLVASGARIARLSGSGSTVFGVFEGSAPSGKDMAVDGLVLTTRTSSRVVQVEVLE